MLPPVFPLVFGKISGRKRTLAQSFNALCFSHELESSLRPARSGNSYFGLRAVITLRFAPPGFQSTWMKPAAVKNWSISRTE